MSNDKSTAAVPAEPVAWTLRKTLDKGETTTRAYLWFKNPQNTAWAPLYAAPQPVPAPAGMVLVPVEPTEAMTRAAVVYANGNAVYKNVAAEALKIEEGIYAEVYGAMLAAAPQATPPAKPAHVPESRFGNIEAAPATEADMAVYDSIAAQYRRESVADQMAPIYAAFGESAPPAAPAPAPVNQELLAALRSLLRHAERVQEVMDEECGIRFRDDGPMGMAREAITRAESGAPAPAPQPLTRQQITDLWNSPVPLELLPAARMVERFARAIERALGITGGTTGAKQ